MSVTISGDASDLNDATDSADRALSALRRALSVTGLKARLFGEQLDSAGDEAGETARSFGALAITSQGLSVSLGIVTSSVGALTLALGGLMVALTPLLATMSALAVGAAGIAAAFGAIIGTGLIAYNQQLTKQNKQRLKQVNKKIRALERVKDKTGSLTLAQQKQLKKLEKTQKKLKDATKGFGALALKLKQVGQEIAPLIVQFGSKFVPLIKDALNALPQLVKSILQVIGPLGMFKDALRDLGQFALTAIPKLVGWIIDLGRWALPIFRDLAGFVVANVVPALRKFVMAGKQATDEVAALARAVVRAISKLKPVVGVIWNLSLAFYELSTIGLNKVVTGIMGIVAALSRGAAAFRKTAREIGFMNDSVRETFAYLPKVVRAGMNLFRAIVTGQTNQILGLWQTFWKRFKMLVLMGIGAVESTISNRLLYIQNIFKAMVGGWSRQVEHGMNYIRMAVSAGLATVISAFLGFDRAARLNWKQTLYALGEITKAFGPRLKAMFGGTLSRVRLAFTQFSTGVRTIWRALWQQLPASVRKPLTRIRNAIRKFATRAQQTFRKFASVVQTGIRKATQTFGKLRTQLARISPIFRKVQRTATKLGNVVGSNLLPAIGAAGLTGVLMKLAPIIGSRLLPLLGGFRGVLFKIATLVAGPLLSGLALVLSPFRKIAGIGGRLVMTLGRLGVILGGALLSALSSVATIVGGALLTGLGAVSSLISGALSLGLTGLITSLTSVSGILGIVSAAFSALLSPIGLVVAAIAGLYLAWKTNLFNIRNITKQVFSAIKAVISGDMGAARKRFEKAVRMIGLSWDKNIAPLIQSARRIFHAIRDVVGNVMNWILNNAIRPALRSLTQLWRTHMGHIEEDTRQLRNFLMDVLNAIKTGIKVFVGVAIKLWQKFGDEILAVVKFAFDTIGTVIEIALDAIMTAVDVFTDILAGDWEGAWNAIAGFLGRTLDRIIGLVKKWGSGLIREIGHAVDWAADVIHDFGVDVWNAIKKWFGKAVSYLKNQFWTDLTNTIDSAADKAFDRIHKLGVDIWNTIKKWFGKAVLYLKNQFWSDLTAAIDSTADAAFDRMHKLGKDVYNTVTNFFGDVVDYFKTDFASDVADALDNAAHDAWNAFESAFNTLIPDSIPIPSVTVGGYEMPGPIPRVPSATVGGGSIPLPSLDVGGTITQDGVYYGHAGETVTPAGVDTPYDGGDGLDENDLGDAFLDALLEFGRKTDSGDVVIQLTDRDIAAAARSGSYQADRRDILR